MASRSPCPPTVTISADRPMSGHGAAGRLLDPLAALGDMTRPELKVPDWLMECQPHVEVVPYHNVGGTCGMATVVTTRHPMVAEAVEFDGHKVPLFIAP